jgi:membrane protein YdbS with pleckstrin-like domain
VVVRPIGTELELSGLRYPRDLADTILAMQEDPKFGLPAAAAPPAARPPSVKSKRIQAALDDLAQPAQMPVPPVPVVRAPFFGFLHRKIPIRFIEGESVVEVVYRHWFVLLRNELIAIALILIGIVAGVLLSMAGAHGLTPFDVAALGILIGGVTGVLIYMNWADDVFLLTTHRVIDIDRLIFILAEYSNDAPYARIQQVRVRRNALGRFLGYGSIVVETSGRRSALQMENIPGAYHVMDRIFEQINLLREREAVAAINRQKQENLKWMATVLNDLVITVPDVRGRSVVAAAGEVRKAGLKLIVEAEHPSRTQAAGTVLAQVPDPGTSAVADAEVRVVLAGNPVAAVP